MDSPWFFVFLIALLAARGEAATREFAFDVAWTKAAPDGYTRPVIGINGLWPPAPLWVEKNDDVVLYVNNLLNDGELITVHTHGVDQVGTNYYDGVDQVTQWYHGTKCG